MTHIAGFDRSQLLLLPEAIDDYVGLDNSVRFIDGAPATRGVTHGAPSGDEAYQDRSMPIGIEASCRLTLPRLFRPRHQCKYEFVNYVRPRLSCGTAETWQVCGGSSAISRKALRVCSRRI